MQKTLILSIFLITYTICADTECSKVTVKNTCQANSSCTWTDAVCAGHTSCTSENTDKGTCEAVEYDGTVNCTWASSTCSGDVSACTGESENACKIQTYTGKVKCDFTAGKCAEKTSSTGNTTTNTSTGNTTTTTSNTDSGENLKISGFLTLIAFLF